MPNILAIETSTEIASVAFLSDQHAIQHQTQGVTNHSQSILPMVQRVLKEAEITLSACDAIAFGAGPGSFTGVRTACGVAQGLAFGADLPVIPVVTLLALAEACRHGTNATHVIAALDARMKEIYWAHYHYDVCQQQWLTLIEPTLSAPTVVVSHLAKDSVLAGNGFTVYADELNLTEQIPLEFLLPQAIDIARLAQTEWRAGRYYSAKDAQPIYLRNKIALTIEERKKV